MMSRREAITSHYSALGCAAVDVAMAWLRSTVEEWREEIEAAEVGRVDVENEEERGFVLASMRIGLIEGYAGIFDLESLSKAAQVDADRFHLSVEDLVATQQYLGVNKISSGSPRTRLAYLVSCVCPI